MFLLEYLTRKPRSFFLVTGTALVILIAIPDYLLPRGVRFSIFYLIPVSLTAWYAGKAAAIYLAVISDAVWFAADVLSGDPYVRAYIPYWNAVVRLAFFLIVVFLLDGFKREKMSAREDYLTGLGNRRNFFELVEKEIKRSQRYGHAFTIAYIDVDDFKSINDWLGHNEGDLLLKTVADVISRNIRTSDIVGRLGGDEFAVLLPESNPETAEIFFNKLHQKLCRIVVRQKPITFSVGVVTFLQAPAFAQEMIRTVDDLMYSAKKGGKNLVKFMVVDTDQAGERQRPAKMHNGWH